MNWRKNEGFTLAEVLITLAIIGTLAALVIPGMMQNIQYAELKTAFKENFQNLAQVALKIKLDNGGNLKGIPEIANVLPNYLSYTKMCYQSDTPGNCWAADNQWFNIMGVAQTNWFYRGFVLNNGTFLGVINYGGYDTCTSSPGPISCGSFAIDVNGFKGPNIIGRDIFYIYLNQDGLRPWGSYGDDYEDECLTPFAGYGCSAWVLRGKDY